MYKNILLFLLVLSGVAVIVAQRYQSLRVEFDNTRFFNNATYVINKAMRESYDPQHQIAAGFLQSATGDLLPAIKERNPGILEKAIVDPFLPIEGNREIPIRFGIVDHAGWTPPPDYDASRPVCFVWSAGPSGMAPVLVEDSTGHPAHYHFQSQPYQASNGIHSEGYLYMDSLGAKIGKIH